MRVDIKVRLLSDGEIAMGPGKADLLEAIHETGSISGAARRMDMSYRRAWLLVGVMNRCFHAPLVQSAVGGQKGGGAHLSDTGLAVLSRFRCVQAAAEAAAQAGLDGLTSLLRADAVPAGALPAPVEASPPSAPPVPAEDSPPRPARKRASKRPMD
jgi:molybdate transport system regulatory protein